MHISSNSDLDDLFVLNVLSGTAHKRMKKKQPTLIAHTRMSISTTFTMYKQKTRIKAVE